MSKNLIYNSLISVLSIIITLSLLEIGLRFFARNLVPLSVPSEVGHVYWKDFSTTRLDPESQRKITIETNKYGYRDRDWDFSDDRVRIMVIGDSFVDATQVEKHERFTELLQDRFAEADKSVEVLNFGMGGNGPERYLLVLKKWFPIVKPTIVVVTIYNGNDFDNINYAVRPDDGRVNYLLTTDNRIVRYSDNASNWQKAGWSIKLFLGKFYVFQFINDFWWKKLKTRSSMTTTPLYCDTNRLEAKDSYIIMKQIVRDIRKIAGQRLVLLGIPERGQEKLTYANCDKNKPENFFFKLAEEEHIPLVRALYDMVPDSSKYYYTGHLNTDGHKLIANLLFDKLVQTENSKSAF